MGLVTLIMTFALLAVCGSSALAQQKPAPRTTSVLNKKDINAELLKQLLAARQEVFQALFFKSSFQTCADMCNVMISLRSVTLKTLEGEDKEYCIATVPDTLMFGGTLLGNNPPKTITWTLNTGNLGGRTVEFHEKSGILKVDDAKGQIDPDKQRTSPTVFEAKNKHKQMGSASYVPVILFRTKTDSVPELCAVGDPKIVNN